MTEGVATTLTTDALSLLADPRIALPTTIGPPSGDCWHALDDLAGSGAIRTWIDEIVHRTDGERAPRDAAGVVTIGRLIHAVVARPTIVFIVQRRALLAGRALWVRRHADGRFDACAYGVSSVLVTTDDPSAASARTDVDDEEALAAALAADWSDVLGPLVEAVRSSSAFGRRGLWGRVADVVGESTVWAAQSLGWSSGDVAHAWRSAARLCDALNARRPLVTSRPRLVRSPVDGRTVIVPGVCCLLYKAARSQQPDGRCEHCDVCPLLDAVARAEPVDAGTPERRRSA